MSGVSYLPALYLMYDIVFQIWRRSKEQRAEWALWWQQPITMTTCVVWTQPGIPGSRPTSPLQPPAISQTLHDSVIPVVLSTYWWPLTDSEYMWLWLSQTGSTWLVLLVVMDCWLDWKNDCDWQSLLAWLFCHKSTIICTVVTVNSCHIKFH